jgi:hypothetical protein
MSMTKCMNGTRADNAMPEKDTVIKSMNETQAVKTKLENKIRAN